MSVSFNERLIAYLTLVCGLSISAVAVYYSVVGLTAIFAAAVIPIIIMGTVLEVGKLIATVWLKQNWNIAPLSVKLYLIVAIIVLMFVTSMGIFGFLSKAHSDQSLVSGDVLSQLAIYDEKIKTAKENIEIKRKELKQMDEAVDQVMARSQDEKGADKSIALRKSQQRDRARISKEIEAEQKRLSDLNNEAAPIRAQVRQVEAEVGPLKYIASFVYGETDQTVLEKAVTWVIIILIVVFDPLAVILLLASQISFQNFRDRRVEEHPPYYVADVGEKPTEEEKAEISTEGDSPEKESDVVSTATVTAISQELTDEEKAALEVLSEEPKESQPHHPSTHPYLSHGFKYPAGWMFQSPLVASPEVKVAEDSEVPEQEKPNEYVVDAKLIDALEATVNRLQEENESLVKEIQKYKALKLGNDVKNSGYSSEAGLVKVAGETYSQEEFDSLMGEFKYIQNEEQNQSGKWKELNSKISEEEYIKKSKKNIENDNSDKST